MLISTLNRVDTEVVSLELDINPDTVIEMRVTNFKSFTRKNTFKKYFRRYSIVTTTDSISKNLITGIRESDFKEMLAYIKDDLTREIYKTVKDYIYTPKGFSQKKAIDYTYLIK